ncbi:hypothetical protein PINS_up013294 [Pythium insidiosum]|nr:hypothetical protein PINS_up013294 [Pythium insidiosum]
MNSDSDASEVVSEAEYEDSFVADEVEESVEALPVKAVSRQAASVAPSAVVVAPGPALGPRPFPKAPLKDDNDDDENYSVDFDEPDDAASSPAKPSSPAARRPASPTRTIGEDAEYEYSFEEESRQSAPAPSSPGRRDNPNVHAAPVQVPLAAPPPVPHASAAGVVSALLSPAALSQFEVESEKSLSLLLRKIESKYQDELEELREQNALLTWRERELKTQVRLQREEKKMRKSRLDKKRQRALERKREHDVLLERLRQDVDTAVARWQQSEARLDAQRLVMEQLESTLAHAERERRDVEARNLTLAEKLQTTLSDFHALNLKYEDAVQARVAAERRVDELKAQHAMECEVLKHKARVELQALEKALEQERDERVSERRTLPETHRVLLDAERQRLEQLEVQSKQRVQDVEAQLVKETLRFEKELAQAQTAMRAAEERAELRMKEELSKIAREREALDEQRRELLVSVTQASARQDEERARLDMTRGQLEVRRLKLVEERAELDSRAAYLEDRLSRLAQEEAVIEARKAELTKLGRETMDKSRVLAQKMHAFQELRAEVERLRDQQRETELKAQESEARATELLDEKAALEKTARQLQQERLVVAKQRLQSRQLLDGAKKLERLLQQQQVLDRMTMQAPLTKLQQQQQLQASQRATMRERV